jgi:hypothetical protein
VLPRETFCRTVSLDIVMLANPSGGRQANASRNQMSTPKDKPASLPKTAALTKAQAKHKAWLTAHGIKPTNGRGIVRRHHAQTV